MMNNIPEGYKQTEVGVIPVEWEVKKLGEIVRKFVNGGTPSTQFENYWTGNIPWITGADILNQKVAEIRRYITNDAVKNSSTNIIEKGNLLLVSRTGVGKLAIAPFDVAISQDFTGIYVKNEELLTEYLYRYFDFKQSTLQSQNQGTSIQGITRDTLSSIPLPLPPLPEQQAIASALTDVDALITALGQLITKKRNIKQGAMQQLLTGKKRLPGFGGEWEEKELPKVCWFQEGPGLRNWQFTSSGMKVINVTNLENGYLNLERTDRYISLDEFTRMYQHFEIDDKDILVASSGNSYAKVAVVRTEDLPLVMNTSVIRFKPSKDLDYNLLLMFLKSNYFKDQIDLLITGGAQPNFGPAHLKKIIIKIPPTKTEQQAIATILSDMNAEIEAMEQKRNKYKALKQGMMQELLTGKTRLIKENKA